MRIPRRSRPACDLGATALQMLHVPVEEVEQLVQAVRDWDYRPVVDAGHDADAVPPAAR